MICQSIVFSAGYECREDACLSSLLGKSVQHVQRYAAFLQTIEYGFEICSIYSDRFREFPLNGKIDELFIERCQEIFNEIFNDEVDGGEQTRIFLITDQVVVRAIDLVSGLLQQLKILMDDRHAPMWSGCQTRPVVVIPCNSEQSVTVEKTGKKKKNKLGMESNLLSFLLFDFF